MLGGWLRGLLAQAHPNTVVVALANKLARIAWAVLRQTSAVDAPASCSRWMAMICSSLNRRPLIVRSSIGDRTLLKSGGDSGAHVKTADGWVFIQLIIAAGPDGLFFDEGDARFLPEVPTNRPMDADSR